MSSTSIGETSLRCAGPTVELKVKCRFSSLRDFVPLSPKLFKGQLYLVKGQEMTVSGLGNHDSSSGALLPKIKAFQYQRKGGEGQGAVRESEKNASHCKCSL